MKLRTKTKTSTSIGIRQFKKKLGKTRHTKTLRKMQLTKNC